MAAALAEHDQVLRGAIADRGGYVFSTAEDSFAAAFSSARSAVEAAVAGQLLCWASTYSLWATAVPLPPREAIEMLREAIMLFRGVDRTQLTNALEVAIQKLAVLGCTERLAAIYGALRYQNKADRRGASLRRAQADRGELPTDFLRLEPRFEEALGPRLAELTREGQTWTRNELVDAVLAEIDSALGTPDVSTPEATPTTGSQKHRLRHSPKAVHSRHLNRANRRLLRGHWRTTGGPRRTRLTQIGSPRRQSEGADASATLWSNAASASSRGRWRNARAQGRMKPMPDWSGCRCAGRATWLGARGRSSRPGRRTAAHDSDVLQPKADILFVVPPADRLRARAPRRRS